MNVRSIAIVTHGYPCRSRPIWQAFVKEIAHAFADCGFKVSVIFPNPFHRSLLAGDLTEWTEKTTHGNCVHVYAPRFISLSSKTIFGFKTIFLTQRNFDKAVERILSNMVEKPDILYGHFLYMAGCAINQMSLKFGLPAFVGVGEGKLNSVWDYGIEHACKNFKNICGFIPNSSELADLLISELFVTKEQILVAPNGVDTKIVKKYDKDEMREKYGLPKGKFLIGCVGYFKLTKGQLKLCEAMAGLNDVGGVFVGSGDYPPKGENVFFSGEVPHEKVAELMSACDIFCLPTLYEGCCNAILEAMTVGLPIVSSNGRFNDDILDPRMSIRVDPLNVSEIRAAIVHLYEDWELRQRMAVFAQEWGMRFEIGCRIRRVIEFMNQRIQR